MNKNLQTFAFSCFKYIKSVERAKMKINFPVLGSIRIQQPIFTNKNRAVSFQSKKDTIKISSFGKERFKLIKGLADIGYKPAYASKLVKEFYQDVNTEDTLYEKLVNGVYDEYEEKYVPFHNIESREDNLTPLEAIVYVNENMDDYYSQYLFGFNKDNLTEEEKGYDVGEADFSPVELAKYINKGFDIIIAGMILKGKMDEETARAVQGYYEESEIIKYECNPNVVIAECLADKISKNLEKLNSWTSDEKDEEGNLKSGLLRPLTKSEAVFIFDIEGEKADTETINERLKELIFDVKGENTDAEAASGSSQEQDKKFVPSVRLVKKPATPLKFKNLQERIDYLIGIEDSLGITTNPQAKDILRDLRKLDSEKFFKRYSKNSINFDVMMLNGTDRELRKQNIAVLNGISNELLNKMTSGSIYTAGHFAFLSNLLKTKDLADRVKEMEEFRTSSPDLFEETMTKESLMDYLTDSDFYSRGKASKDEFLATLRREGIPERKPATIIPFKKPEE